MSQTKDLSENQLGLFPLVNPDQVKEVYKQYYAVSDALLVPYDERIVDKNRVIRQESDYARIPQTHKYKGKWVTEYQDAPRKSAFRKLARVYGVSTMIVDTEKTIDQETVTWHYTVRAWQNKVSTMGIGACSTDEKKDMSTHDAKATAHTRAKNRAISDLIAFGQVSAEEINHTPREKTRNPSTKVEKPRQKTETKTKEKKPTQRTLNPDEETVIDALLKQGLSTINGELTIKSRDDAVYVQHPLGTNQTKQSKIQEALDEANLEYKYHEDKNAWEVTGL